MSAALIAILVGAALAVMGWIYFSVIRTHLNVAGVAMGKDEMVANAQGFWATLDAKLTNWKTIVLAMIAALAQIPNFLTADMIKEWQSLPWGQVVSTDVANTISLVCTFLIPIVHAMGIAKAAVTPPQPPT